MKQISISSKVFSNGSSIPAEYTCDGEDRSPHYHGTPSEKSTAVKWHKHERSEYFGLIAKKIENKADLWERGYIAFDLRDMFK